MEVRVHVGATAKRGKCNVLHDAVLERHLQSISSITTCVETQIGVNSNARPAASVSSDVRGPLGKLQAGEGALTFPDNVQASGIHGAHARALLVRNDNR